MFKTKFFKGEINLLLYSSSSLYLRPMLRAINIILLSLYCYFALAGFPGTFLMKKSLLEDKATQTSILDLAVSEESGQDDSGNGQDPCSKCNTDVSEHSHHFFSFYEGNLLILSGCVDHYIRHTIIPDSGMFDILTPPPKS